jgi:hypothetical protein
VHNAKEISNINPKSEAARIAHTVGKKKRAQIKVEAKERKVIILNFTPVKELVEAEEEEEQTEEADEEQPEKPTAEKKESVKKEEKPKRRLLGRRKSAPKAKKEQKAPVKKAEKPKTPRKKAKTEKGAEEQ